MSRTIGRRRIRALCFTLILIAVWAMSGTAAPVAAASTITVSTCDDASVQNAINSASSGDTIDFSCSGTIALGVHDYEYLIAKDLTIDGTGQSVTFDGQGIVSMFYVAQSASLTVKNLTFKNGVGGTFSQCIGCSTVDYGGAITAVGPLTIENSTFSNNQSTGLLGGGAILAQATTVTVSNSTFNGNGTAASGGGILSNIGTLNVTDSTFSNNSVTGSGNETIVTGGGGIAINGGTATISGSTFDNNITTQFFGTGAGVANGGGTMTITNSTFFGNSAEAGGAISNNGNLTVVHSTLVGNSATDWGNGILNGTVDGINLAQGGTVTITNSILANGPVRDEDLGFPAGGNCVTNGTTNNGGGSFADDDSCGVDQVDKADLKLGSLADNGGPTQTIAIGSDSVAVNTDTCSPDVPTDQRGYLRPITGDNCDAGAYEYGAVNPIKSTSIISVSGSGTYGGTTTLTATLTSSGAGVSGALVSFTLNGTPVGSVNTNASGVASLGNVSLNGINAGDHPNFVDASFAGNSNYTSSNGSGTLTVSNAGQNIVVGTSAPLTATYSTSFTVAATADSGLTVSYGSSGACSNAGAVFTMTSGTGSCTVSFVQAGDANHDAAPTVIETVTAVKSDQSINFDLSTLPAKSTSDSPFDISRYAGASSGLPVSFASQTTPVCTVSESTVTIITSGKCTISASQGGNDNYATAEDIQQSFDVADKVPPTTSARAVNANSSDYTFGDWTHQAVTVSLTAVDSGGSGVALTYVSVDGTQQTYTAPVTISTEGSHTVEFWSTDNAGNEETPHQSVAVKIDLTAPSISGDATVAPNANGWYRASVTIHWTCNDSLSGIATCPSDQTISDEGANQTVSGTAVDNAGNSTTVTSPSVNIDLTAPTISGAPSTSPNSNGWYDTPVTIHWTCSDRLSQIDSCPSDSVISSEGTNQTASGTAVDKAGNSTTVDSPAVKIDTTAPTVVGTPTTDPNSNGWYNTSVIIHWSCVDSESDIASCPDDQTISSEGSSQTVSGTAVDNAGNSTTVSSAPVSIDLTAPTVVYSGNQGSYAIDQTVNISCVASDDLSGIASTSCADITGPAYSFAIGTNNFDATATDAAGNTGDGSVSFTVVVTADSLTSLTNQFENNKTDRAFLDSYLNGIHIAEIENSPMLKSIFVTHYISTVNSLRGRTLTDEQADLLIKLVQSV